jgi:hypothetical protein
MPTFSLAFVDRPIHLDNLAPASAYREGKTLTMVRGDGIPVQLESRVIVSSVSLDHQTDFYFYFSQPKKNTAIPTKMARGPWLARHLPLWRSKIDKTITLKLSTKKEPKT